MSQYFTKQTDEHICDFLQETDEPRRHEIFNTGIKPAFEKLIENLIYVYKFFSLDDVDTLKRDCLAHLYIMLPKYDPSKGTKGFSYFNVVAKNWFIHKAKERTKKNRVEKELHVDVSAAYARNNPNMVISPHEDEVLEKEFWMTFYAEMEQWRPKFLKKSEKHILEAVIFLMQNSELVSIYNKKAVYLYLREMTGLNEKQVAIGLKKLKVEYKRWREKYLDEGR